MILRLIWIGQSSLRFKELCDLYPGQTAIGVVPANQDTMLHIGEPRADYWEYLHTLQSEGWCIAQHGYTHIYNTHKKGCFPLNALSEYAGNSYEDQYASLEKGQKILKEHEIHTDIFMAPAHSYDYNTLKALRELGFTKITDGFGRQPYQWQGLTFYPISFKQSNSLKQEKGYTTFVVHANTMNDQDFARYEQMFAQYKDKFISYTEYLQADTVKRSMPGHWIEHLKALGKYILVQMKSKL